jgi:lipopolysaccharide biosynthesis regulator YciM
LIFWSWNISMGKLSRSVYKKVRCRYNRYCSTRPRFPTRCTRRTAREVKRALELDPLSLNINWILGVAYNFARQYDQAIEQYRKTLELDPNFFISQTFLGVAHALGIRKS